MIHPRDLFTVLLVIFFLFVAPAFAGDEDAEESAAAQLFRNAWWSETGAGELDKAYEGYRKAAAAKGSEKIRARSVYRMAIVLERMGRTEEGVRALERLANEFPGQTDLLGKAKKLLDQWTAEDLRNSFGDWYRRYQYSAAFQAKIVDLILKLGGSDKNAAKAAHQELLTIGEPALAALREHSSSANSRLRDSAIKLMVQIGSLPSPDALWKASGWRSEYAFWKLIYAASDADRAAYLAAANERQDDYRAQWIAAALAGEDDVLRVIAAETNDTNRIIYPYLASFLDTKPGAAVYEGLRRLVHDAKVEARVRSGIAGRLAGSWHYAREQKKEDPTGLTAAEIVSWVNTDDRRVRDVAFRYMRGGDVDSPDAWKAVAEFLMSRPARDGEQATALAAMFGSLRTVDLETDVERAVQAVVHYLEGMSPTGIDTYPLGEGGKLRGSGWLPRSVLGRAIGRAKGQYVRRAPSYWWNALQNHQGTFDELFTFASRASDLGARSEAMQLAAQQIRDQVKRVTDILRDDETRRRLHDAVFKGLYHNPKLLGLDWDAEALTRLAETAVSFPKYAVGRSWNFTAPVGGATRRFKTYFSPGPTYSSNVFARLLYDPRQREHLLQAAARHPTRFPWTTWSILGEDWGKVEANRHHVIKLVEHRWAKWSAKERNAAVRVFVNRWLLGDGDARSDAFLRRALSEEGMDEEPRLLAVQLLSKLSLDDLKAIYDLNQAADVDQAVSFLERLPRTTEVYDAFVLALRPDSDQAMSMHSRFQHGPEERIHDLITGLLGHQQRYVNQYATALLNQRDSAKDIKMWMKVLIHRDASLRAAAAGVLGRLYDQAAIRALAKAVDDPDPDVRDAALKSLERIENTEKQKAYWRQFAKDVGAGKK